jgi:hypothetical protein
MDEHQVTEGTRYLFITPTLKGVLDDYSYAPSGTQAGRCTEGWGREGAMGRPGNQAIR